MKLLVLLFGCIFCTNVVAANSFITAQWATDHGTRVLFYQAKEVPMLNINLAFSAGAAYEGKAYGLAALTTRLLNQGNQGLDANQIEDKLSNTGAQYDTTITRDMSVLSLVTLTTPSALQEAINTFSLIATHPDFPEQSFQRLKNQQLVMIDQEHESPDLIAQQTFYATLYPHHPYGHPINGTKESIQQLTRTDVKKYYETYFVAENAILVLVGDIDVKTAHVLADQITQTLPAGQKSTPIATAVPLKQGAKRDIAFTSTQTVLYLGQLGITHHNPAYFPFMVGNYILGGGSLVSRLAIEVREKRGLTYGVVSQFEPMLGTGPFSINLSTKNNQAKNALDITEQTLNTFIQEGPNEAELKAAKSFMAGAFPLSLASNKNIADILVKVAFYQLPDNYLDTYLDKINAVTTQDIKHAFQSLIKPSDLVQVVVGQA